MTKCISESVNADIHLTHVSEKPPLKMSHVWVMIRIKPYTSTCVNTASGADGSLRDGTTPRQHLSQCWFIIDGFCGTHMSNFPRSAHDINTLRPTQYGRHFPDDIFKWIFLNENVWISIEISLKFVPKGQINNIPALVRIMAWRRPGDKPLSEPMMVGLLTHICVTRPQWVNL